MKNIFISDIEYIQDVDNDSKNFEKLLFEKYNTIMFK